VLYHASRKEKFPLLLGLLRKKGMERTMIFVNTKREAEFLQDRLNANEFPCKVISGDVEQRKRMKILADFKEGTLPIMIATDVASRGIHIEGVSHVINYDLPQDCEDYVHRIGRTARAGAEGMAISLADEDGAFYLEAIEEFIKQKIPTEWAEDDMFVHDYKRSKPRPREDKPAKGGRSGKGAGTGRGPAGRSSGGGRTSGGSKRHEGKSAEAGKGAEAGLAAEAGRGAASGAEASKATVGSEAGGEKSKRRRRGGKGRSGKTGAAEGAPQAAESQAPEQS